MRVCSVTILYYPDNAVLSNISSYSNYAEKIFIIDNTDNLEGNVWYDENLKNCDFAKKIVYIREGINTGIATALNLACRLASAENFDWILTMDQDSRIINPAFYNYCIPLLNNAVLGIIGASFSHKMPFIKPYSNDSNELMFTITSGNLVRLSAWQGNFFEEKLFIDEVDNDFCLRLKKKGYKIISSKEILLMHAIGDVKKKQIPFTGKIFSIGLHSPIRSYYITRNILYVIRTNFPGNMAFCINRLYALSITMTLVILFYPQKFDHIRYHYRGIRDFLYSRYGKIYS